MDNELLHKGPQSEDQYLARLYRLQVQELEDYAFFLSDVAGRIITWNKGVEVAFGYKEEEFVGQNLGLIFTEEDRTAGIPESEMTIAAVLKKAASPEAFRKMTWENAHRVYRLKRS